MKYLGKYEVIEQIGEGGFGKVYRGRDPNINRQVAIKTCTSQSDTIRERFFREAHIAGNLFHPNIVTILDFGQDSEPPFIIQEFLEGRDLKELVVEKDWELSLVKRVHFLTQIAEALEFAHANDVIHRDIKPANVRVLPDDRVKVMDFGIAKLKGQETGLTETGVAVGTVAYLSPEQLRGETIDHRADLFSFGVLAYELLTYTRPFPGKTFSNLCYQILQEQPQSIGDLIEGFPPEIDRIVMRCLAKEPSARFEKTDGLARRFREVRPLVGSWSDPYAARVARSQEADHQETRADTPTTGQSAALPPGAPGAPSEPPPDRETYAELLGLADRAREALERGDFTQATLLLQRARETFAHQPQADQILSGLDKELAEVRQERSAERRRREEFARLAERVRAAVLAGNLEEAETALGEAQLLAPGDSRLHRLAERVDTLRLAEAADKTVSVPVPEPPPSEAKKEAEEPSAKAPTKKTGKGSDEKPPASKESVLENAPTRPLPGDAHSSTQPLPEAKPPKSPAKTRPIADITSPTQRPGTKPEAPAGRPTRPSKTDARSVPTEKRRAKGPAKKAAKKAPAKRSPAKKSPAKKTRMAKERRSRPEPQPAKPPQVAAPSQPPISANTDDSKSGARRGMPSWILFAVPAVALLAVLGLGISKMASRSVEPPATPATTPVADTPPSDPADGPPTASDSQSASSIFGPRPAGVGEEDDLRDSVDVFEDPPTITEPDVGDDAPLQAADSQQTPAIEPIPQTTTSIAPSTSSTSIAPRATTSIRATTSVPEIASTPVVSENPTRPPDRAPPATTTAPAVTTPSEATSDSDGAAAADRQAVRSLLQRYEAAWEALDAGTIRELHPASGINQRTLRRNFKSVAIEISNCQFDLTPSRGIATCQVTRRMTPRAGPVQQATGAGFRLRKEDGRWIITALF